MKKEITQIDKISFANAFALLYGFVGFIVSAWVYLVALSSSIIYEHSGHVIDKIAVLNAGAFIFNELTSFFAVAVVGWILGFITTIAYNFLVKEIGGVKVTLKDVK